MQGVRELSELNELIADAAARASATPTAGSAYPTPTSPAEFARLIDHTLLKPTATELQIRRLCLEAKQYDFVTVCINPVWVALCSTLLTGSNTAVCTVVGFPLGATTTEAKVFEAQQSLANGARELDMVINIGALQSGDYGAVYSDISAIAQAAHAGGGSLKVIIEAAYLSDQEKVAACVLAQTAGADYVKTSTGFGPGGAAITDVALMRHIVGAAMGVKAAGGIRTLDDCNAMIGAGASRIGASAGVSIMQEAQAAYGSSANRKS